MVLSKDSDSSLTATYFLSLGGGVQASWTAVVNGLDYFKNRYPEDSVSFKFPIAIYTAQFIVTLIMHRLSARFTFSSRIIIPLIFAGVILASLPFEAAAYENTRFGFYLIMGLLFIMGFSSNVCYSSIIGITSQLPHKYVTLFLIGSGLAGVLMSVLREIMTLCFKGKEVLGVLVYFLVASAIMVWCVVLHTFFMRTSFFQEFVKPSFIPLDNNSIEVETLQGQLQASNEPERDFYTLLRVFAQIKWDLALLMMTYIQMFTVYPGVMLRNLCQESPLISWFLH